MLTNLSLDLSMVNIYRTQEIIDSINNFFYERDCDSYELFEYKNNHICIRVEYEEDLKDELEANPDMPIFSEAIIEDKVRGHVRSVVYDMGITVTLDLTNNASNILDYITDSEAGLMFTIPDRDVGNMYEDIFTFLRQNRVFVLEVTQYGNAVIRRA